MSIDLPAFAYAHNLSKKYTIVLVGIKVLKMQDMLEKGSGSEREGGTQKYISLMRYVNLPRSVRNCALHPLIHTGRDFTEAQNAVDGQVKAIQKITPIDPGHRSRWGERWEKGGLC